MRLLRLFLALLFFLTGFAANAQNKPSYRAEMLDPDAVGEANLDTATYFSWLRRFGPVLETAVANDKAQRAIILQITLTKSGAAKYKIGASPALKAGETEQLIKAFNASKPPATLAVDYSIEWTIRVNGGNPGGEIKPPVMNPRLEANGAYVQADFKTKMGLLEAYARDYALPLLAREAARADTSRPATRRLGQKLIATAFSPQTDVEALIDRNPDFWLALVEQPKGDYLAEAIRANCYAMKGQIDQAHIFSAFFQRLSDKSTLSHYLLRELDNRLTFLAEEVDKRIESGRALNEKGAYKAALKIYNETLAIAPFSAKAVYERYVSSAAAGLPFDMNATRKDLFAADPLYKSAPKPTNAEQAYDLSLHEETRSLFKNEEKRKRDFVRLATIALELKAYPMAAHFYRLCIVNLELKSYGEQDLEAYFAYALARMNVSELKTGSAVKPEVDFPKIDAQLEQNRLNNDQFKAFSK